MSFGGPGSVAVMSSGQCPDIMHVTHGLSNPMTLGWKKDQGIECLSPPLHALSPPLCHHALPGRGRKNHQDRSHTLLPLQKQFFNPFVSLLWGCLGPSLFPRNQQHRCSPAPQRPAPPSRGRARCSRRQNGPKDKDSQDKWHLVSSLSTSLAPEHKDQLEPKCFLPLVSLGLCPHVLPSTKDTDGPCEETEKYKAALLEFLHRELSLDGETFAETVWPQHHSLDKSLGSPGPAILP